MILEPLEVREGIISVRVQMLAAVFGRKCPDQLITVFKGALGRFPTSVLGKAFSRAETNLERFPTPKIMQALCGEAMPSQGWRFNFEPKLSKDPETGEPIRVLVDPDPSCDECRESLSLHPTKTCIAFIDKSDARSMYRPQNCPEGRAFLAKLRELGCK